MRVIVLLLLIGACGCQSSTDTDPPRIVSGVPDPCELLPRDALEAIVDASVSSTSLGNREENVARASCYYRYEDGGVGSLTIEDAAEWQRRYDAERAEFEEMGVLLPDEQPVSGLGDEAFVDVRGNQLNVRSGDFVLRADHGRRIGLGGGALTEAEEEEGRDLQEQMIVEALSRFEESRRD